MTKDLSNKKKENVWANIALLVLYPYSFLTALVLMQGIHIIYPSFLISILVLIFVGKTCFDRKLFSKLLFLQLMVLFFMLMNMLFVGNTDIKNIVYGVFIFPALGALLFFYKINYWTSIILFGIVSVFFSLYIIQNGPFPMGENGVITNSRNYVPFFVTLYCMPYFIHCHDYDKIPSLIIPVICLIISIFAIGRGGIIMSFILLLGVLYMKMFQGGKNKYIYRMIIVFLFIFILLVGISADFIELYFGRFTEVGMKDAGRSPAWIEYSLSLLNPINLLLGTNVESLNYLYEYLGGSLHNSFFTLHAREGLIGLFLVIVMIKGYWILIKEREMQLVIVLSALLFKGLSDADTGGTYSGGDIYVYFLFLVYYYYKSNKKYERKSLGIIPTSIPPDSRE